MTAIAPTLINPGAHLGTRPGLAQTVITASAVTGVQLREDMDKGVFDRFRSLPIARIGQPVAVRGRLERALGQYAAQP